MFGAGENDMKQPWTKAGTEPPLSDVLADPIVLSLMKADRVTRWDVLWASASVLERTRRNPEPVRLTS